MQMNDDRLKKIGERLKLERERLNLNQSQFGEVGGVKKNAQLRYEKGERSPDANYLQLISSLGADVLYIITGQRNENVATTPIEISYLRICRSLPNNDARMAGNAALGGILSMYGIQLNTTSSTNDSEKIAAQDQKKYDSRIN